MRWVFKKGKRVELKKRNFVVKLADNLVEELKPYSRKIEIAGSVRRREKNPVDIDIVLIPKNKEKIVEILSKKGEFLQGGEKKVRFRIKGVKVEIYYTDSKSWGATLLAYSSRFGAGIGLRVVARRKGFKLNQYGLWRKGKRVAGKTEQEIYHALGRRWKPPEER